MKHHALLVLTAAIWGFAFVAQRKGNAALDPLIFNALRFALGALCVLAIKGAASKGKTFHTPHPARRAAPILLGVVLFIAASLQQVGMLWTGAGSAGFITGLYVVFIPLMGILLGSRPGGFTWLAVILAAGGLWLINSGASIHATFGNALVLVSSVFWAVHVILVGRFAKAYDSLTLAAIQYAVCAILSLLAGLILIWMKVPGFGIRESIGTDITRAAGPILYGGMLSVGIAYTLQLYAQKMIKAHLAGIILCMEAVFAMLGGIILLGESYPPAAYIGAMLVLAAMLAGVLAERNRG